MNFFRKRGMINYGIYANDFIANLKYFKVYLDEIESESCIRETEDFLQHGTTSRYLHSVAVAYYSYKLAIIFGIHLHLKEIVRGGLLHDYYLYDTKVNDPALRGHGHLHPKVALKNASLDFRLTELEQDIILKHMFPVTITPPKYKEGFIVSLIDKACAVYEFLKRKSPYPLINTIILGRETTKRKLTFLQLHLENKL